MKVPGEACSSTLGLPPETFIYNIVPVTFASPSASSRKDALSFVAAASNDTLTLFSLLGPVYSFAVHHTLNNVHKSLSCLQLCHVTLSPNSKDQHVVTAGRDGRIKFWSLASFQSRAGSLEFRTPNGQGISALAQSTSANLVAAGTELETDGPGDVAIYIWKVPSGQNLTPQPILALTESHTDTITNIFFHQSLSANVHQTPATGRQPAQGKVMHLVTSSTDGLVNVFDLDQPDEDDAVVSVVNTRSAIQYLLCINDTAGAFGASGSVCVVTQDEKIAIYSLAEGDAAGGQQVWDIRQQLHCDYAIDLRPLSYPPDSDSSSDDGVMFAVGACKSETTTDRRVDIYTAPRNTFGAEAVTEPTITLVGGHGEEVVRDVWLHKDCPVVLTCGEDGHVRAWQVSSDKAPGSQAVEAAAEYPEAKVKKTKKQKTKDHQSGARFKPY